MNQFFFKMTFPLSSSSILFFIAFFALPCFGQLKKSAIPLPTATDAIESDKSDKADGTVTEPEVPSRWVPAKDLKAAQPDSSAKSKFGIKAQCIDKAGSSFGPKDTGYDRCMNELNLEAMRNKDHKTNDPESNRKNSAQPAIGGQVHFGNSP